MNQLQTAKQTDFPMAQYVFLIFLTLKLTHVIQWSWLWVTSPIWILFALYFFVYISAGIVRNR